MKKTILSILLFGGLFFSSGCSKTTLSANGVYHGDTFLYNAEKTIVNAHTNFKKFLEWELKYRAILPIEVSQAADLIRLNEEKWIDSANALHDAYIITPTPDNKDKFQVGLNLVSAALEEAANYMIAHKSKAPNTGISLK